MQETVIDTRQIYSLTDFLRNYKTHIANLKETKTPEVLTVNGRAEVVIMDAESYQNLVEQVRHMQSVSAIRRIISRTQKPGEAIAPEELARRTAVMDELTAETERLGLYR